MRLLGLCAIFVTTLALAPVARAADATLKDAIMCSDFKHNAGGSWYAKSASLNYGPNNSTQSNFFDTTITSKSAPDVFAALNEKCAAGK
jgi:hypothetical protein